VTRLHPLVNIMICTVILIISYTTRLEQLYWVRYLNVTSETSNFSGADWNQFQVSCSRSGLFQIHTEDRTMGSPL